MVAREWVNWDVYICSHCPLLKDGAPFVLLDSFISRAKFHIYFDSYCYSLFFKAKPIAVILYLTDSPGLRNARATARIGLIPLHSYESELLTVYD
jgi:hypothetical protein